MSILSRLFNRSADSPEAEAYRVAKAQYKAAIPSAPTTELLKTTALNLIPTSTPTLLTTAATGAVGAALTLTGVGAPLTVAAIALPSMLATNVALQDQGEVKELGRRGYRTIRERIAARKANDNEALADWAK